MIKYIIQGYEIISRQKKEVLDTLSKSVQKKLFMAHDNRKANTKRAIQEAMVSLLKTKSFDDITTIKLLVLAVLASTLITRINLS